ncbi:hypothetical protein Hanom_Chr14g01319931 [Helianthus anomalus]
MSIFRPPDPRGTSNRPLLRRYTAVHWISEGLGVQPYKPHHEGGSTVVIDRIGSKRISG